MAEPKSETVDLAAETVNVANIKVVAETPSLIQNLMNANMAANQQAMYQIMQASVGKIVETIIATQPTEAGADIAALGQLMKGLQLTPPPSA